MCYGKISGVRGWLWNRLMRWTLHFLQEDVALRVEEEEEGGDERVAAAT